MRIISYVVTHDYGFAPNPYHDFLTLATCKPKIREYAKVGDLVIGTGSVAGIGLNKLIYAAIISEVVSTEEYSTNPRFEIKKPHDNLDVKMRRGDNIYYKDGNEWKQRPNNFHDKNEFDHDLSSQRILICEQFWYFGDKAPNIPEQFSDIIKEKQGHKYTSDESIINGFMVWLNGFEKGIQGSPSSLKHK